MPFSITDDIQFKIFKKTINNLQNKNIIQSVQRSSKTALRHFININNKDIIHLKKTCMIYNRIINMDTIKKSIIGRNININNTLNLQLMKKKMLFIKNIINELTIQNFNIQSSNLTVYYTNKLNSYKNNLKLLTEYIDQQSFPSNLIKTQKININLMTPQQTPERITQIEDTPKRLVQPCHKFYKR